MFMSSSSPSGGHCRGESIIERGMSLPSYLEHRRKWPYKKRELDSFQMVSSVVP